MNGDLLTYLRRGWESNPRYTQIKSLLECNLILAVCTHKVRRVGLEPTLPFPVQIKSLLHNLSANDAYIALI